jgi:ketoreductase RED2
MPEHVALVTGSSSGIGAAVATALASAGTRVVVNSARSIQAGKELAERLPGAVYLPADISIEDDAQSLIQNVVDRMGRLDLLVNNAGTTTIIPHSDLDSVTPAVWRTILDVNLIGTWQVTAAAVPHLRATGAGAIVNISSVAGCRPAGSSIPYAVSKAAINHLTRLLAASLGPAIRVNAVAPGLIDTAWTAGLAGPREQVPLIAPMARIGTPADVAEVVVAVARSAYMTGEVVLVDGGVHLR